MKIYSLAAVSAAACLAGTLSHAAGPFDAFKGKVKPGMYEMKMDVDMGDMPGLPPGMGKQSHTIQHCVTQEAIDRGEMNKGPRDNPRGECQVKNMNVSGNTGTWTMECPNMKGDARMTFTGDGYKMDSTMTMNQGGRAMTVRNHTESRYLGPCK